MKVAKSATQRDEDSERIPRQSLLSAKPTSEAQTGLPADGTDQHKHLNLRQLETNRALHPEKILQPRAVRTLHPEPKLRTPLPLNPEPLHLIVILMGTALQ